MYKNIRIQNLYFEMLALVARKNNKKPEDYVETLIQSAYTNMKK
jgi:hypothetical protein